MRPKERTDISSDEGKPSVKAFQMKAKSGLKSFIFNWIPYFPEHKSQSQIPAAIASVRSVVIAAHLSPCAGIRPQPLMKIGSKMKFKSTVAAIM